MKLPEAFVKRMNEYFLIHPELNREDFYSSFDKEPRRGIRFNRLKVNQRDTENLLKSLGQESEPVSWCRDGYYVTELSSGKDAYYHAGVYYIQEPSAMLPAEILGTQPGEKILDLCAAPGGKATRIGADLCGSGLLVANEISEERSRALLRNIELFGIENVVITNETPIKLEKRFASFFDRILIDAPCSGEGMFRRDRNAVRSWERYGPSTCEVMQREILSSAHCMLAPGGHIVYSTCTFGTSENEDMIDWFLKEHPEYEVVSHPDTKGVSFSRGKLFEGSMRIWPQSGWGDGHFCVHLKKSLQASIYENEHINRRINRQDPAKLYSTRSARDSFFASVKELLTPDAYEDYYNKSQEQFVLQGEKVHLIPVAQSLFDGLKVVKMGAFPGEVRSMAKGWVFVPSHAFALALSREKMKENHIFSLSRDDQRLLRYLHGETLLLSPEESLLLSQNAYILLLVDSFPIGWGKSNGCTIKNLYPKAWRLQ
ncbi:MAG: RsmB/NOP family class I SAM-dependent RNA methyltransferase [Eubacteriales bacterium]